MKPELSFDLAELIAQLNQAAIEREDQTETKRDWFTVAEACDILGFEATAVRRRLYMLAKAGMLEYVGLRPMRSVLTGQITKVPAYKIKESVERDGS